MSDPDQQLRMNTSKPAQGMSSSMPGADGDLFGSPAAPVSEPPAPKPLGGNLPGNISGLLTKAASKNGLYIKIAAGVAVLGGLYLATVGSRVPTPVDETKDPHWITEVQPANDGYKQTHKDFYFVDSGGAGFMRSDLPVTSADLDPDTTSGVAAALRAGDPSAAQAALLKSCDLPAAPNSKAATYAKAPMLTQGMAAGVLNGDSEFMHLFLWDNCYEDGDVVTVVINGEDFATITLTHKGATISVPIPKSGSTSIQLRGVYDGGGGVTCGCRTSTGDFFCRSMDVGEVCSLATVNAR